MPTSITSTRRTPEGQSRSAARVLDVLDLFLDGGSCLTLKDVSERLGIPKSTVHGILHAMRRRGYLSLDPETKSYAVSLTLIGRTTGIPSLEIVRQRARRHLERLAGALGETAKLIGYEGLHSVAIDYVEGERPLKYAVRLGQRWPLHATGGGKLFLAQYADDAVRDLLGDVGLEPITENTIVDIDALLAELADVRRQGWARQREEVQPEISGFAAPVRDTVGGMLAALVVMGPTARIDTYAETIVAALRAEAAALSRRVSALPDAADAASVV